MKLSYALVIGLAACGGDSGGIDLPDYGTQLATTLCTKAFSCCTQAQLTSLFESSTLLTTSAQCDTYVEQFTALFSTEMQASVANNRAAYDGNAASDCLDTISQGSCAVFDLDATAQTNPPGCSQFLKAQVGAGGGCAQNYECTTGYCKGATMVPTPMDGMCMPPPTAGQACTGLCASGLYCDFATSMTCQAKKPDGGACQLGDECTSAGCQASVCGAVCTGP